MVCFYWKLAIVCTSGVPTHWASHSRGRPVKNDGMADNTDDVLDNWEDEDAEVRLGTLFTAL